MIEDNIQTYAKMVPGSGKSRNSFNLEGSLIQSVDSGESHRFNRVYPITAGYKDMFEEFVRPLADAAISGLNTTVYIAGLSDDEKSFMFAGSEANRHGFVPLTVEYLFHKLGTEVNESYLYDVAAAKTQLFFTCYEVWYDLIKDLNEPKNSISVAENAINGVFVPNCRKETIYSAKDGTSTFRNAFAQRTQNAAGFEDSFENSAIVAQFEIVRYVDERRHPNKSTIAFVCLPGIEPLAAGGSSKQKLEEPAMRNKLMLRLDALISTISTVRPSMRTADFGQSTLTSLLEESLGGNALIALVCIFKESIDSKFATQLLRFACSMGGLVSYPILNDVRGQGLLELYRAKLLHLKQQISVNSKVLKGRSTGVDLSVELKKQQRENVELRDRNDYLYNRVDGMQNQFGYLSNAKTDLSTQLLILEEERLKAAKSMVDMQIENNRLEEKLEATRFELMNKVLVLENQVLELEGGNDRMKRDYKHFKALATFVSPR